MNNKNILLSVIIPVYNADKYLKNTFDSLISQTVFQNLEIIIINDGSTDNSRNICEEFQKNYDNAVLINQQNFGVSAARNAGIKISRGKYITFLDADDYIENNLYEKELDLIISNNADIGIIDFKKIFPDKTAVKYRKDIFTKKWNSRREILKSFFSGEIGGQVTDKIFLSSVLKKNIIFPEKFSIGEDAFFLYLFLKEARSAVIDTSISGYHYIIREKSAMKENFSDKYFDSAKLSQIIYEDCKKQGCLSDEAEAYFIHEICKAVEYAYIHNAGKYYYSKIQEYRNFLKMYSIRKANHYLIKRRFWGFMLMRYSPDLYLFFHKIMKIG